MNTHIVISVPYALDVYYGMNRVAYIEYSTFSDLLIGAYLFNVAGFDFYIYV